MNLSRIPIYVENRPDPFIDLPTFFQQYVYGDYHPFRVTAFPKGAWVQQGSSSFLWVDAYIELSGQKRD